MPTGLTTIGTEATTIPASGLEKFKAPTPKTGETSFTASITSGDQVASGVRVAFDTEGFTDAYAKYKVTVDGQVIKGLTVAELKEGVGPFTIGSNQTARVTSSTTTRRTPSRASAKTRPSSRSPSRPTSS